jgi:hypothetical protein
MAQVAQVAQVAHPESASPNIYPSLRKFLHLDMSTSHAGTNNQVDSHSL